MVIFKLSAFYIYPVSYTHLDVYKRQEHYVLNEKNDLIWFNAREKAVGFYERLGYKKNGNPFSIADIGIHYLMFKKIG